MKNNQPKSKKAAPEPAKPETPKSRLLQIVQPEGVSMDKVVTDMAAAGLAQNAGLVVDFSRGQHGELSLTDMVKSLKEAGQAVNANNFAAPEQMLNAQATALNSIFTELARRAALNMGEYMEATDRYMRLALKAQSQCRSTLETLAAIKNPPVVYAKQANIAHGPQQVNNGVLSPPKGAAGEFSDASLHAHAHGNNGLEQTKLLEGTQHGGTVLDAGATRAATGGHPELEAVGALLRPEDAGRQG